MNRGTVKFFNDTKGFGFITDEESNKEYFVHANGLVDEIRENDEVTFDLEEGRKGLNAVNVKQAQASFIVYYTLTILKLYTMCKAFFCSKLF